MSEPSTRRPLQRLLWVTAALLALAVAGYAVKRALPLLNPTVVASAPRNDACNLREGPCSVRFADGAEVQLALEPLPIPPLRPLAVTVEVQGVASRGAELDLAGVDMNMGFNRPALTEETPGHYRGTLTIPVCVHNRMDWEARVLLRTDEGLWAAPFRFATYRSDAGRE